MIIEICLNSFSTNLVDLARKCSFYISGSHNSEDIVFISLKILTKFARMKAFGITEIAYAFSQIGINSISQNETNSNQESEAIFCVTINKNRGINIDSEVTKNSLCKTIENDMRSALNSPRKLEWLNNLLNEDETLSEYLKEGTSTDFNKIELNVIDIFPGSNNVMIQLKYLYFPEDPTEVNYIVKIVQKLLENLPSVSKVGVNEQTETRHQDGILSMKVHVGNKYLAKVNKKKLNEFLENFIENVRTKLTEERDDIEATLLNNGMAPLSIERVLENLFEPDKIEFNLQPNETCKVEVMTMKNLPLWPSNQMRLLDLSNRERFAISKVFRNNFEREIWEDVAEHIELLNDDVLFLKLQEEISNLDQDSSPYPKILDKYKEKFGTIGGIIDCLIQCKDNKKVTARTPIEKIDCMLSIIQEIKETHFIQWIKQYQKNKKISGYVASYEDFKKAAANSKSTRCLLGENGMQWNEDMRRVIKEGDQIWIWRKNILTQFAHVGIFIGQESIVHVQRDGSYGVIRTDPIEDVIKDSQCFIVKPDPKRLEMMWGTPKDRALACVGLQFIYSVRTGTCEVFTNCVALGIWDTECACIQGDEHPHIDNVLTGFNRLTHFKPYKAQQKDLMNKLSERLRSEGFVDDNILQISRISEEMPNTENTHKSCQQRQMDRYFIINVWEILENISSEKFGFKSDRSNEENGRICVLEQTETDNDFQLNWKSLFNNIPKDIRNVSNCSIEEFVNRLDTHLSSQPSQPINNFTINFPFLYIFSYTLLIFIFETIIYLQSFC
eukprot:GFUD01035234.1.p1 GENE.GFUD01035234.1~~GFUD01035234.1.p1  ORF type:complete len:783 (-),score=121.38 GFUD01035234.1:230-2578(-)